RYQTDYLGPSSRLASGDTLRVTMRLFAGAKEVSVLDRYTEELGIPLFDRAVDFGYLYFLTKPIFRALNFFYLWLGNFGLAILLLTVLIKALMFPLANKSFKAIHQMKKLQPMVDRINGLEAAFEKLSDDELRGRTAEFRQKLDNGASLDDLLPDAFAAVREASKRTLGMRHYDVQLIGGIGMHQGVICEMRTGEGKTLTATSALYLNALEGRGAHLITVNDYLASRDAEWMGEIYKFLGMTVGTIVHGLYHGERQRSYRCDITYGTNNEFGFDYLRDNMKETIEKYVQRDLHYAIVD
ncbi:MAG: membrane protein insertase YidC, partial [Myxococcales bacterium]|nr:membrane protein insertase YidC [Myxococcales bacterium]